MNLKRKEGRMSKELTTSWGEKNLRERCLHLPPTRNRLYYIQEASHLTYKNKTHVLKKDARQQELLEDIFFSDNFACTSLAVEAPTDIYSRKFLFMFAYVSTYCKIVVYSELISSQISKSANMYPRQWIMVKFGSYYVHLDTVVLFILFSFAFIFRKYRV